jgi:hypothetical protein
MEIVVEVIMVLVVSGIGRGNGGVGGDNDGDGECSAGNFCDGAGSDIHDESGYGII